jgi:hypothetical protein
MVDVEIPKRFQKWFTKHRAWPVQAEITGRSGCVKGGKPYHLQHISPTRVIAYKMVGESVLPVGEMTPQGLLRPLSDAVRHDLGVLRAVLFNTSYPAPVAYEMGSRELVHPGECFNRHASVFIRRTLHSVVDEEARCAVCKGPFE